MTADSGNLSIDFLAGFTIFIISFIWVATIIPGLLIGLQSQTVDYDAVAYRTGVILSEDWGWPAAPTWESNVPLQKYNVTRFGLARSKDAPLIFSQEKINGFFCTTAFIYPEDYQQRAIFGEIPYHFNISLRDIERDQTQSVGDILPDGYGYIRRLGKIKGSSNATIDASYIASHRYTYTDSPSDNVTTHVFSILINNTQLLGDMSDPTYQIDPSKEQIVINITDLSSTIKNQPDPDSITVTLKNITIYKLEGGEFAMVRTFDQPYLDGKSSYTKPPAELENNVSMVFEPRFFDIMSVRYSKVYINLTFDLDTPSSFLNNSRGAPFNYDYQWENVTQPRLRDAVLEVAVW